ncbi:DegV family protein [Desulfitibacter alkalitolerans]|uniref:DegV family protein n=1 Tax=Desulfitibacter alkalitolerans TaxID=264641 RepID=UPI000480E5C8|nr:DegV family protein [Desulfitibacter alkalitolerans]
MSLKEKIALITDTSCDLPQDTIDKYNIHLLPLKIIYPDKEYDDRLEISPEEIYSRFPEEIPTTSMPSRDTAAKLFEDLRAQGYQKVLAILLSSGLSATYEMVENLRKEFTDMDIRVINSKSLSMGLGFLVVEGAKLLEEKKMQFEEIVQSLKRASEKIKVFYAIPTLEYLRKGGRIGLVSATLGSLIDLKPVISINEEGKYYSHAKVRGRKKSVAKIIELVEELTNNKRINIAVMHGDAEEEGLKIKEHFEKKSNVEELFFSQISPALVVHTGPGLVGVCYQLID